MARDPSSKPRSPQGFSKGGSLYPIWAADETIVPEVIGGRLDTVIGLYDGNGNLVAVDDDGGAGLLSKIVYQVPSSDLYTTFGSRLIEFHPTLRYNGYSSGALSTDCGTSQLFRIHLHQQTATVRAPSR